MAERAARRGLRLGEKALARDAPEDMPVELVEDPSGGAAPIWENDFALQDGAGDDR